MSSAYFLVCGLAAVYLLFLYWYGGNGKPLRRDEIEAFERELAAVTDNSARRDELDAVRELIASDDGKEFVMLNLVRYRDKAEYPPGYNHGDSARAADRRYARAILWPLLRNASLMLFVAPRSGRFMEAHDAQPWDYVAMVRYRSRRDFLRFALSIQREDIIVHKWAAIESTQIFPVKPLLSLVFVRAAVAVLLLLAAAGVIWLRN
jgi:hypothetical protein